MDLLLVRFCILLILCSISQVEHLDIWLSPGQYLWEKSVLLPIPQFGIAKTFDCWDSRMATEPSTNVGIRRPSLMIYNCTLYLAVWYCFLFAFFVIHWRRQFGNTFRANTFWLWACTKCEALPWHLMLLLILSRLLALFSDVILSPEYQRDEQSSV